MPPAHGKHANTPASAAARAPLPPQRPASLTRTAHTRHRCPDHRLARLAVQADSDGAFHVSGVFDASKRTPTLLTLEVQYGSASAQIQLSVPKSAQMAESDLCDSVDATSCGAEKSAADRLGRLLAVQHALQQLEELKLVHHDPQAGAASAMELAKKFGLASEHTTLLLLSLPEQFVEHGLECPKVHPAHAAWSELTAKSAKEWEVRAMREESAKAAKRNGVLTPLVTRYKAMRDASLPSWGRPMVTGPRLREGGEQPSQTRQRTSAGYSEQATFEAQRASFASLGVLNGTCGGGTRSLRAATTDVCPGSTPTPTSPLPAVHTAAEPLVEFMDELGIAQMSSAGMDAPCWDLMLQTAPGLTLVDQDMMSDAPVYRGLCAESQYRGLCAESQERSSAPIYRSLSADSGTADGALATSMPIPPPMPSAPLQMAPPPPPRVQESFDQGYSPVVHPNSAAWSPTSPS